MFRPEAMRQLRLVILERDARTVLQALGALGAVELSRAAAGPATAPLPAPDHAQELESCAEVIARVADLRRRLGVSDTSEEPSPGAELPLEHAKLQLASIEAQVNTRLEQRQQLEDRLADLTKLCNRLGCYRGTGVPLDAPDRFAFLHFVAGSMPAGALEGLHHRLSSNVVLLSLPEQEDVQPLIAMTTRREGAALDEALEQAGFKPEPLPFFEGVSVDALTAIRLSEKASVNSRLRDSEEQVRVLASEVIPLLANIGQAAKAESRLLKADTHFPRTAKTVLITGWIPARELSTVEEHLVELTNGHCLIESYSPEGVPADQIPVLLTHPWILRPFGKLVKAYGLPNYQELEPTLFVALSYVLMFGMMFGDAGHGAVLAAVGLGLFFWRADSKARDVGLLLLFGGLSSLAFGIVYGSYFGLPQLKQYALWHDPLEANPLLLIKGAIRFGVVLISLGLILNTINRFRRGDFLGGCLGNFGLAGLLFYWGMLVFLTQYAAFAARGVVRPALLLFLLLPVLAWSARRPLEHIQCARLAREVGGISAALVESAVSAFEAILSYVANTISFVRLAAYAMSHSALLLAGFVMAAELKHVSFGGTVLSVLVIIAANVAALVLEGVIASVQALRLEYYEFFGKFFLGNGRAFEPFRLNGGSL